MQAAGGTAIAERVGRRLPLLAYSIAGAGFVIDLVAKTLALTHLDPTHPPVFLGGLLTLQLVFNPGAAFSLGESFTVALSGVALVAFGVVGGWFIPRVRHTGWAVAFGLLLAGISGNLFDRLFREPGPFRGHVVDFIQLPHFAIFNVADMCITAAAILIIWLTVKSQVGPDGRSLANGEAESQPSGDPR